MSEQLSFAAPRGLYFEEFIAGSEVTSPARTVTESDIYLFAGLTGDYNPIHTDAEFAKGTPFGQRIAHGLLGLSLAGGLGYRIGFLEGTTEAFTDLEWKFSKPVFIGDTVRLQIKIAETRAMKRLGGGLVTFEVHMLNQRDEVVQRGVWRLLIRGKPQS